MSSSEKPKDTSKGRDPLEIVREAKENYSEAIEYSKAEEAIWKEVEEIHRKDLEVLDKAIAHLDANQAELDKMSRELKESAETGGGIWKFYVLKDLMKLPVGPNRDFLIEDLRTLTKSDPAFNTKAQRFEEAIRMQARRDAEQADSLVVRYKALQKKMDSLDKTSLTYEEEKRTLLAEQTKLDAELDELERRTNFGTGS